MRLEEILSLVLESSPADWHQPLVGPTYLDRFSPASLRGQTSLEVDWHHAVAVYREDVRLRLGWGLSLDSDLDFGWQFPTSLAVTPRTSTRTCSAKIGILPPPEGPERLASRW